MTGYFKIKEKAIKKNKVASHFTKKKEIKNINGDISKINFLY